jgi:endonuclease/exonuclease/phosphatase (EEP) superfamily protein YafD
MNPATGELQPTSPKARSKRAEIVWKLLSLAALASCLPTLFALAARQFWLCELLTHFRVYYLAVLLPLFPLMVWRRKWWVAGFCGFSVAVNLYLVLPLYGPPDNPPDFWSSGGTQLRCLVANVYTANRGFETFLTLVEKENPDVVLVMEVDDVWNAALAPLRQKYPHSDSRPRPDNFGIACFSRLPTSSIEFVEYGVGIPSVVAKIAVGDRTVTFVGTHTLPPMRPDMALHRNEHLHDLAQAVGQLEGTIVVAGDLNATSWSPYFRDLVSSTGLRDSRQGFGVQPTWNARRRWLRIPLDHVLVTKDVEVVDRRVGDDVGSDHLPVVVDLDIKVGEE